MRSKIKKTIALFLIISIHVGFAEVETDNPFKILAQKQEALEKKLSICKKDENHVDCIKIKLCNMAKFDQDVLQLIYNEKYRHYKIELEKILEKTIEDNTKVLIALMEKFSWFPISQFGAEAEASAWLIVQHSKNLDLQHRVLFIMSHLLKDGESNANNYALLYDRVALQYQNIGIKQKFGTQFYLKNQNNEQIIKPYEGTIADIEARRLKLKISSLAQYKNNTERLYGSKLLIE